MQRSGLALAVLGLLFEAPSHPYRMQQLIRERGKDAVINVGQRSQLYKTIDRLLAEELIDVAHVERSNSGQERTVYAITAAGRALVEQWMADMLSAPRRDFPEFAAALAHLPLLTVERVTEALESRLDSLRTRLSERDRLTESVNDEVPRLFLVEDEYLRAHLVTDIEWLEKMIGELRSGELGWNRDELIDMSRQGD